MPRSFDVSVDSPASVDQVHAALSAEEYWLARLETLNGSTALESLVVDDDQTVRVTTTQDLGRDLLPGIVSKFYRRDIKIRHIETWTPSGGQLSSRSMCPINLPQAVGTCIAVMPRPWRSVPSAASAAICRMLSSMRRFWGRPTSSKR